MKLLLAAAWTIVASVGVFLTFAVVATAWYNPYETVWVFGSILFLWAALYLIECYDPNSAKNNSGGS